MARTFGGLLFYGAENLNLPSANQGVAAGTYSWTLDANGHMVLTNTAGISTVKFVMGMADLKRPYFQFPSFPGQGTVLNSNEFQEAFGTTPSVAGGTGPGDPFAGKANSSTAVVQPNMTTQFGTPSTPWGLAVLSVFAVYAVTTAVLTTATIQVNRARFAENLAYGFDTPLAATAISTATTTSLTTPHTQVVSLTQPLLYEQADFSNLYATLVLTTGASTLVSIYGIGLHVAAEYS